MNAIDILTREKLNRQHLLDNLHLSRESSNKITQELANIKRALETLKLEAQRKAGV